MVLNPTGCRMLGSMWISQRLSWSLSHDMEGYSLRFREQGRVASGESRRLWGDARFSPLLTPGFPGLLCSAGAAAP